jgi:hypothetical protein
MNTTILSLVFYLLSCMKNGVIILLVGISILISCVNHDTSDPNLEPATDASLFDEVSEAGYVYYQNGNTFSSASPSPHGAFKLRFNSIAASALDNTGELPVSGSFPVGSIIVKESYQSNNLNSYVVIKKVPQDPNAGNGWIWGWYQLDGTASISIEEKGSKCTNCHSETPNRDLVRTFDLH